MTGDTTTTRPTCTGTGAADERAVSHAGQQLLDTLLPLALRVGPATTGELVERLGRTRPYLAVSHGCSAARAWDGCGGHAEPGKPFYWQQTYSSSVGLVGLQWMAEDLRRWLKHAEKAGAVQRIVLPGVQAHLWSLR